MYEIFFNLTRKPFDLLPDPDFLYMSRSHKRALSYLDYGIRERAGFILLTGEVGSGKTTIIRNLIKKHLDNVVLSKIFNTKVDSEQLIAMINDDFGLAVQHKDKITLLRDLNTFLIEQFIKGNRPVLIIDEAQNLCTDLLEEIRMLSNLETDNAKLLQIILVGQPELRDTLASPSLIQLRQRISINCHIHPLTLSETEEYILHRMEKAGGRNSATFSEETINIIFGYSRGIPRLINIICDFILLAAFAEETSTIDVALVKDVIGDLDFNHHFWGEARPEGAGEALVPEYAAPHLSSIPEKSDVSGLWKLIGGDSPEAEPEMFNQKMYLEMTAKISDLEQSLKSQQEKTGTIMQKLRKYIPMLGGW
ncbi:XrtA/PEP-CTERM system-associated ATPase [Geobacter sp. SVR]|uniref:XrtA/PEP-CTERM system-associated ATPase n=1 Tax=Geobacter sp. SVR TaxID=2495594 RepID=UPI00143EF6DC|nr:XrtA/PEP-CTERM system-associated ATPase [Geobacter sp. SVR]BCS54984.1 ATPase [Geobacter sp. SVR]GCF85166.1 ATPase [Geobacter sp. SVR]